MGKTDKRLHARTQAPDMAARWEATFQLTPKRPVDAKYVVGRGWVVPCPVPPLSAQSGPGRVLCCWGCDGWHNVSTLDATPETP